MIQAAAGRSAAIVGRLSSARWLPAALLVLIVAAGTAITWLRVPADHRDRVWAEDSNIFLAQALDHGPLSVLFTGYAGYQHFVPRTVIAAILPFLDLQLYPVIVFAVCALLTGLTAGAVFWLSRDLVPWLPGRVALGLITVVLPLATQETIGNLADLHTYAMWLTPWLLLYRPRTWATSVGWVAVAFAVVMTEIQAVFFVFLLLFRLRRRDRRAWPVLGAFLLAAAGQVATALTVDRGTGNGPLSLPSTVMGWMINTVMPLVTADPELIRRWIVGHGLWVALVILVPLVLAALVALVWGDGDQRLMTAALLLGSAAIYTGSAWANSDVWFMYAEQGLDRIGELVVNIRYGVASGMMLVAVVPIAAAVVRRRLRVRWAAELLSWGACIGLIAILVHGCTMTISPRNWVDRWSPAVVAATAQCRSADASATVTLPVAPDRSVDLRCEDVLAHASR